VRAIRIRRFGDAAELKLEEAELPRPRPDRVLVRIHVAGVNPVDWKIRRGGLGRRGFPLTMGQDFAGEVIETGSDLSDYVSGDRVYGFAPGSYTDYAAVAESKIAKIFPSMSYSLAAGLPTPGLTALQLVRDVVRVRSGMSVLIHGGAGSVGTIAIELARHEGARVFATASARDRLFLRSLGVERVFDYRTERFEEYCEGLDAVIDLVGSETLDRSYSVLGRGGTLVSTVANVDAERALKHGIRGQSFEMNPNSSDLATLVTMVSKGIVRTRTAKVLRLSDAREAQRLSESGRAHGKILLKIA
jgi:NADPH:quinone reductase-like Zn-dependent oxidoreductase